MAKRGRDAGREAVWREAIGRQAASGLGVRAFCRREQLSESAFHWWRREIARRDASKPSSRRPSTPPAFLPVMVENPGAQQQGTITIELAGRRLLRLPASMPAIRLAEVVQALEAGWAGGAAGGGGR